MRVLLMLTVCVFPSAAFSHENHEGSVSLVIPAAVEQARVDVKTDGRYRYIESNGIPDHKTGSFPNRGNPNRIAEQSHKYRVALNPARDSKQDIRGVTGVAINGIPFEPGTAEFWNGDRDWNYEALSGKVNLGLDDSNAHVQPNGTYHYHGIPWGLVRSISEAGDLVHVGYASDGFGIYVSRSGAYKSSYQVRQGSRSDGPRGSYDGTFTADYEYVAGSGDLDECNGAFVDSEYRYFATKEFPQLPRCAFGVVDSSFQRKGPPQGGGMRGQGKRPPHPPFGAPPRHGPF